MADEEEISWPYTDTPYLGIRLKTGDGEEHPLELDNEELVMIDTGYDGEIVLPNSLYTDLGFNMWEEPELDEFGLADGRPIYFKAAQGYLLIPKLHLAPFSVRIHTADDKKQDTGEIMIGVKFIRRFKLLLDGPAAKVRVL